MCSVRNVGPLACPARFERATWALEWLANLGITMPDNGLQRPDLTAHQNTGGRGADWDLMSGLWCLQAWACKTIKKASIFWTLMVP